MNKILESASNSPEARKLEGALQAVDLVERLAMAIRPLV